MSRKTIAVDFDGVIHTYSKGWNDGNIYDVPIPGAKDAMQALMDEGYELVIYSTRCHDRIVNDVCQSNQVREMVKWLQHYEIPFDRIHTEAGKPLCVLFIDDNALRFVSWEQVMEHIHAES